MQVTDRQTEISSAKVIGSRLIFTFFFLPVQTIFTGNLKIEHLSSLELICCDYLAGEDHNFLNWPTSRGEIRQSNVCRAHSQQHFYASE